MKLVDILARELKVWPDDLEYASQDWDGEIRFYGGREETIRFDFMAEEKAIDCGQSDLITGSKITRAEWQAAVDALNQSELDAVLAKNEQLAAARAERIQAWNGEGLPPVGAVCEIKHSDLGWVRCEIVAHKVLACGGKTHGVAWIDANTVDQSQGLRFRPIRTPEQIAAEEREAAIREMAEIIGNRITDIHAADDLYDAGYRKQEQK